MKSLLCLILFMTFPVFAQTERGAHFSAFTAYNTLHLTILGDSCNQMGLLLKVDGLCHEDRKTLNYATICDAEAIVTQTELKCADDKIVPHVVSIHLDEAKVAREAKRLNLTYSDQTIQIPVNK